MTDLLNQLGFAGFIVLAVMLNLMGLAVLAAIVKAKAPRGYVRHFRCACGHREKVFNDSLFFLDNHCCPSCGDNPDETWTLVTELWVSESTWWKPRTWCAGFWYQQGDQ